MYDNLARRAILAALSNDWESALRVNMEILEEFPDDTDALNRAARAYLQIGDRQNAVLLSEQVIKIDPLNSIAKKCLKRCLSLKDNEVGIQKKHSLANDLFLEIPGRTKIVSLVNLCESSILAHLDAGDFVSMIPRVHKVAITTGEDTYIGRLPDDIASRVIHLIRLGNEYKSYIKSVVENDVKIFIKETKKSDALGQIHSFPFHRLF